MKKAFLFLSAILLFVKTQATVIYTEAFESDLATVGWTNSNLSLPWGNALFGNFWYNDDMESGLSPGTCGNAMLGDQSVYIGPFIGIFTGAAYDASSQSNVRISSPAISTVGYTNLVLSFNFIGNGDGNTDKGYLQYSTDGGTTWGQVTAIDASAHYPQTFVSVSGALELTGMAALGSVDFRFKLTGTNGGNPTFEYGQIQVLCHNF